MKYRYAFLAALALAAAAASTPTLTLAQQQPNPGHYRGGSPPEHMPPAGMIPRDYQKGDRIDPEFRNRQFVVDNWRQHGLQPPPRGYHWVGLTGRYYLVRSSNWTVQRVGP